MKAECQIKSLAWSNEGNRILTAGDYLQLWQYQIKPEDSGIQGITISPSLGNADESKQEAIGIWRVRGRYVPQILLNT